MIRITTVNVNGFRARENQIRNYLASEEECILAMNDTRLSQNRMNIAIPGYRMITAIVRPIFEYSSLSVIDAAEVHLDKLQLIQNQALRVILRLPAYISIKDLHDCSGFSPIKVHLISHAKRRLKALLNTSPLLHQTISEFKQVRHIIQNASVLDILLQDGGFILNCP